LSADHREVLERFYLRQEGTQFEIAEAMGLSVAAFNSRLNRARLELKRILEGRRADIGLDQARTAINRVRRYF
jgi:DNA-directed RNA polymerase specialized sigma24 family protein